MSEGPGSSTPSGGRPTLRAVGLLGGCLALSVGSPVPLVVVPLTMGALLLPDQPRRTLILGAILLGVLALGGGGGGLGDVSLGWSILLGGGFVAATLVNPERSFTDRALPAVGFATVWSGGVLAILGGWSSLNAQVAARIQAGTEATLSVGTGWFPGGGGDAAFREAVEQTAEVQLYLFPAQAGLAGLLGLGAAWWLLDRMSGAGQGVGPLRGFRFPDALVWVLIGGLLLLALAGGSGEAGRAGANLAVFAGALFALRGAAVLLARSGGVSLFGGVVTGVALVVAAPVVLAGALMVGLGDLWWDLRARVRRNAGSDRD